MANKTIYPFGVSGTQPGGAWPQKIANIQDVIDALAPWAFRETPSYANSAYRGAVVFPTDTNGVAVLRFGYSSALTDYIMSPLFQLGEVGDPFTLRFSVGESVSGVTYPGLIYYDENVEPYTYHMASANPRTVSGVVSATMKYVRLIFRTAKIFDSYIINGLTGETMFDSRELDLSKIGTAEDYRNSVYWGDIGPNSRGDWIGWNFGMSDTAATAQRTDEDYPLFRRVGSEATPFSYGISKVVELPKNVTIDIEFSCGVVNSGLMLRLLNPSAGTANYYGANANPRTVSINTATYTHVQLYFLTENYADCYIKDATNNVILWQGAASTD